MRAVLIILLTLVCGVQLRLFQESPFHNGVESHVRHKRDIPATLKDMTYWFDDALKAEFAAMKSAGKSEEEIFAKIDAEFKKLPAEKQQEISTKLKDTCKGIFKPMLSDEEIAKLKTYMTEQKHLDAVALIKTVVAKQPDAVRPGAEKAQKVCSMIYNKGKAKRDVNTSINKHLHWLTEEQKAEIKDMSKNGASNAELKSKLMGYIQETSKNGDKKEATVKSCYKWLESVATADEIKALHAMHHTDHAGCKKKVREFMEKLPAEEKKQVESNLEYCESLWYGSHDHSGHKHEHKHEHKHGHRRRRHLTVIEPITYWMTKEQLKALEESFNLYGEDFSDFNSKFEDFLEALPTELRQNVTEDLKAKCSRWAKEVSKPAEWGHIKKYYAEKDFVPLKDILRELEFRLTENQMHMIEHARPICYKLWDISTIARLVRSPHSRAMEARELREDSYF